MNNANLNSSLFIRQPKVFGWVSALLLAAGLTAQVMLANDAMAVEKKRPLLNSLEFKGSLRALTKWTSILSEAKKQVIALNHCSESEGSCPPGGASWKALLEEARNKNGFDQLKYVNAYLNKWPYRLDRDVYGISDYWATPQEFLARSGDCEDYCITKYFALKELGYTPKQLRIVVLRDEIRNIAHATLAVYLEEHVYILDNISNAVFDQKRYTHYTPQYSFNENNRWAHIPLKKSPAN
jgi:predicted transglutaminase-like cysteine proteinase